MRSNKSEIALLAVAIALLAAACATPEPPDGRSSQVEATLPADSMTEGAEPAEPNPASSADEEPADLAPPSTDDEAQAFLAIDASISSDEIIEKLKMVSASGADDPVLILSDDFSSAGWLEFTEDEFTSGYMDQAYELSVKPGGFSSAFGLNPSLGSLTDFYFQIETQAYGPADNGYGIRFREQEAGFYEFIVSNGGTGSDGEAISSGGTFSVDKFAESGIERIVPFKTESQAIAQGDGELNLLGVLALGSEISLYINGQEVASFSDPNPTAGTISLRVYPYFEGGSRTIFDNAAVWVPTD